MRGRKKQWLKPLTQSIVLGIRDASHERITELRREGEDPFHYEVNLHLANALLKAWKVLADIRDGCDGGVEGPHKVEGRFAGAFAADKARESLPEDYKLERGV